MIVQLAALRVERAEVHRFDVLDEQPIVGVARDPVRDFDRRCSLIRRWEMSGAQRCEDVHTSLSTRVQRHLAFVVQLGVSAIVKIDQAEFQMWTIRGWTVFFITVGG